MAKKTRQTGQEPARTCGHNGCTGNLAHGNGNVGCDNPTCSNHWEKWKPVVVVDERTALLAAIAARKAKNEQRSRATA